MLEPETVVEQREHFIAAMLYLKQIGGRGATVTQIMEATNIPNKYAWYRLIDSARAYGFIYKYGETRGARYVATREGIEHAENLRDAIAV